MAALNEFSYQMIDLKEFEVESTVLAEPPAWFTQPAAPPSTMRLEGPSTLALALVGAGTVLAYRSIQQRLTPSTKAAAHAAVARRTKSPRRRAA